MAMKAEKGVRFYRVQINGWDGLAEEPALVQGEVTGGGDQRVVFHTDGELGRIRETEDRRSFEARMFATPEEAWWSAAREIDKVRVRAFQELRKSVHHLRVIATEMGIDGGELLARLMDAEEGAAKVRESEPF